MRFCKVESVCAYRTTYGIACIWESHSRLILWHTSCLYVFSGRVVLQGNFVHSIIQVAFQGPWLWIHLYWRTFLINPSSNYTAWMMYWKCVRNIPVVLHIPGTSFPLMKISSVIQTWYYNRVKWVQLLRFPECLVSNQQKYLYPYKKSKLYWAEDIWHHHN